MSEPYLWNRYLQRLQIECAAWSCGLILHCCLPSNSLRYWTKVRGIAPRSHTGRPRTCLVFIVFVFLPRCPLLLPCWAPLHGVPVSVFACQLLRCFFATRRCPNWLLASPFSFFFFLLLCFSLCGSALLSQRFLVFPGVISWSVSRYLRLGALLSPLLLPSGCVFSLVSCLLRFPSSFLAWPLLGLYSFFRSLALSFLLQFFTAVFWTCVSHFLFSILSVVSGVSVLRLLDFPWGLSLLFEFRFFSLASASCSQLYFLLSYSGVLASCFPTIFWGLLFLWFHLWLHLFFAIWSSLFRMLRFGLLLVVFLSV